MIVIIDYEAGNTQSVMNALNRLNVDFILSDQHEEIRNADKVILPGVGHAGAAMHHLKNKGLDKVIPSLTQPMLGICVGMQLLGRSSEEGDTTCLGIMDYEVKQFAFDDSTLRIPHMGWNTLQLPTDKDIIFDGIDEGAYVYYVHSYYVPTHPNSIAQSTYGHPFTASVRRDNFWGIQFHAEKSSDVGAQILFNFVTKS